MQSSRKSSRNFPSQIPVSSSTISSLTVQTSASASASASLSIRKFSFIKLIQISPILLCFLIGSSVLLVLVPVPASSTSINKNNILVNHHYYHNKNKNNDHQHFLLSSNSNTRITNRKDSNKARVDDLYNEDLDLVLQQKDAESESEDLPTTMANFSYDFSSGGFNFNDHSDLIKLVEELESEASQVQDYKLKSQTQPHLPNELVDFLEELYPDDEKDNLSRVESRQNPNENSKETRNTYTYNKPIVNEKFIENKLFQFVSDGIEESIKLSEKAQNLSSNGDIETNRNFAIYLFQGHYMAEPRLNRFVDGATRNMATEIKDYLMDPLYFRVLPRGRVIPRNKPPKQNHNTGNDGHVEELKLTGDHERKKQQKRRKRPAPAMSMGIRLLNKLFRRSSRGQQQQQKFQKVQKIHRTNRKLVGGGKIDGFAKATRDGDAEMQPFGNYTLIRSHIKYGPVELSMQFRTRKGIRRTFATIPVIRAHSVARVNREGSEMVDFIVDRIHPEVIKIRGSNLFPLARRIAKNIFARLFLPKSFLVSKLREKCGLAFLSKPSYSNQNQIQSY